ncbi:MAG: TIR domain-containing protein [Ginsengibacter sp.]
MATKDVFYSFHFDNDVFRVQQIRNIGSIEENEPVSVNEWEKIKGAGNVEKWIDNSINKADCVVVLIGEETYKRPLVKYEIKKAWESGKGLIGIYIHNINCMKNGKCSKGKNPFEQFNLTNGKKLSEVVKCYDPNRSNAYKDIADNIDDWVDDAIKQRK